MRTCSSRVRAECERLLFRSGMILLWLRKKHTGTIVPSLAPLGVGMQERSQRDGEGETPTSLET